VVAPQRQCVIVNMFVLVIITNRQGSLHRSPYQLLSITRMYTLLFAVMFLQVML